MSSSISIRIIQRAVILKLMGEKTSEDLTADIPGNIFPSKNPCSCTRGKKRRKIRVKEIEIRRRNKVGFLLKQRPKHLKSEFLINSPFDEFSV
jgi:hypothetical protein